MVWRKASVSARKAEDHAERRRPVNQPRGLNRRESAPFDSARRCGLLLPKFYPLARKAAVEKEDLLDIPLILHRFAAGNRALDANRDRASARCRDLQCPGRRSLCHRAKRAGLSADHGRPSARAAKPAPLLPPALPFPGNSPSPCPETLRRLYQSRRCLSPSCQVPSRIRQNAP